MTRDNCKKDRTICKKFICESMLDLMSTKRHRAIKQDFSNKQGSPINSKNVDPDFLLEKFTELYNSNYASNEKTQAACEHAEEVFDEI